MYDKRLTATDESAQMVKVASDETDALVKSGNCESSGLAWHNPVSSVILDPFQSNYDFSSLSLGDR